MKSMDEYLEEQIKILKKIGYEVTVVRLGDWATFHVKKTKRPKAYYPLPSHDTIQVLIKESLMDKRKKYYHLQDRELFNTRNYKYDTFEKFKKGFQRNIMKNFKELIK